MYYLVHFVFGKYGGYGEAKHRCSNLFCLGECLVAGMIPRQARLLMQRNGVVNQSFYPLCFKMHLEFFAFHTENGVNMMDTFSRRMKEPESTSHILYLLQFTCI